MAEGGSDPSLIVTLVRTQYTVPAKGILKELTQNAADAHASRCAFVTETGPDGTGTLTYEETGPGIESSFFSGSREARRGYFIAGCTTKRDAEDQRGNLGVGKGAWIAWAPEALIVNRYQDRVQAVRWTRADPGNPMDVPSPDPLPIQHDGLWGRIQGIPNRLLTDIERIFQSFVSDFLRPEIEAGAIVVTMNGTEAELFREPRRRTHLKFEPQMHVVEGHVCYDERGVPEPYRGVMLCLGPLRVCRDSAGFSDDQLQHITGEVHLEKFRTMDETPPYEWNSEKTGFIQTPQFTQFREELRRQVHEFVGKCQMRSVTGPRHMREVSKEIYAAFRAINMTAPFPGTEAGPIDTEKAPPSPKLGDQLGSVERSLVKSTTRGHHGKRAKRRTRGFTVKLIPKPLDGTHPYSQLDRGFLFVVTDRKAYKAVEGNRVAEKNYIKWLAFEELRHEGYLPQSTTKDEWLRAAFPEPPTGPIAS
jgi:hypothetical protein